jgi:hypothetical protein
VNPFAALHLAAAADLTDDQVRAAWRAIAARAHPDRADGGDPAAYAAAAAAYAQLRTPWGRSEALADLAAAAPCVPPPDPVPAPPGLAAWHAVALLPARIRHGRPPRLVIRAAVAAAIALAAVYLIPGTPSEPAVIAGCALWWVLTARSDLAPPPGR